MLYSQSYISPIGTITLLSDEHYLLGLWFKDQKYYASKYNLEKTNQVETAPINKTKLWLDSYFKGEQPDNNMISLNPKVTEFRQNIFKILKTVPYGQTITYKSISNKLKSSSNGNYKAFQAVGGAVGHNPISIIIPCHRVIGSDGSLTGYAGGIDKKIFLLKLEGININDTKLGIIST